MVCSRTSREVSMDGWMDWPRACISGWCPARNARDREKNRVQLLSKHDKSFRFWCGPGRIGQRQTTGAVALVVEDGERTTISTRGRRRRPPRLRSRKCAATGSRGGEMDDKLDGWMCGCVVSQSTTRWCLFRAAGAPMDATASSSTRTRLRRTEATGVAAITTLAAT